MLHWARRRWELNYDTWTILTVISHLDAHLQSCWRKFHQVLTVVVQHYMVELNYDNGSTITVKATNKEDTIRFKFERACNSMNRLLKRDIPTQVYEAEWVMLVNDADLHECLQILDFGGGRTFKFLVLDTLCPMGSPAAVTTI
ncbi:hypothetical protein BC332_32109 [Capsicum chinense]|nr:hypothetical protein BC332_32109 [Capsicum chinense]